MVWNALLRNCVASVGRSNDRTPPTRSGLLKVAPPFTDFAIITASSCEVYANRRHET